MVLFVTKSLKTCKHIILNQCGSAPKVYVKFTKIRGMASKNIQLLCDPPLRPQPTRIHSGSMKLTSMLMQRSLVGNTDVPPQICSRENCSYKHKETHSTLGETE